MPHASAAIYTRDVGSPTDCAFPSPHGKHLASVARSTAELIATLATSIVVPANQSAGARTFYRSPICPISDSCHPNQNGLAIPPSMVAGLSKKRTLSERTNTEGDGQSLDHEFVRDERNNSDIREMNRQLILYNSL